MADDFMAAHRQRKQEHDERMAEMESVKQWIVRLWIIGVAVTVGLDLLGVLP